MKTLRPLLFFVLLVGLLSCEKSESPEISVDHYVELLRSGKYDSWELPIFSSKDIPKLLSYRNELQPISTFPINRISSSTTPSCSLGMYVIWTIESIRARSIGSAYLTGTFPSQNPVVELRENFESIDQNQQVQKEVADTYFDWWNTNEAKDFSEFDQVDPLATTAYRWH